MLSGSAQGRLDRLGGNPLAAVKARYSWPLPISC
jgi:hypothetical protein